ncbi:hypothetical protein M9H77_11563 [Catharanthus roseus]|uniref:Uncharacterized protein n=1 Tax=Catharanthus roseus TaxID=4058 RepID=A0ACC0BEZ8_CATRO|nr:hypothetical protein M9H77_11563 [Catharanthus roseus]
MTTIAWRRLVLSASILPAGGIFCAELYFGTLDQPLLIYLGKKEDCFKGYNNRGKRPPFKKGGQISSLFKARYFECNSTDHLVADCPKAIEKEKKALEAKL